MQVPDASTVRTPLFVAPPPLNRDGRPVIQKLLIANRGEIACRIIQTCRKLHITSVAIYVDEDALSRHVQEADESINLGSIDRSSRNPFLDVELLVKTAVAAGAHAVHPGYGFLSENADFAQRVHEAGLIFVGPSPSAMSTLGDKRAAKDYLSAHAPEVPLIPGFAGSSQEVGDLEKAATEIGLPVMLKASAGGGGKGMRIIREAHQLRAELQRAQSEAQRSFGSADCILEKYIESSKHVEIQILGDSHGEVVSFFDRDCSVQRRHQKVIEETPCPFLDDDTRRKMSAVAVTIAKKIGYANAGTVEFIFDVQTGKFYFLEVNARLQVEHPITEEVTGVDLVALQLYVAAGGRLAALPAIQTVTQRGHAIECRLCAEDPQRDYFPEHGQIYLWQPASGMLGPGRDIRYETAVGTGSSVSIYFDSMIAKIVVWAPTRAMAIEKMTRVLAQTACVGVKTNQLLLQRSLLHPAFHNPGYTTSFLPRYQDELLQAPTIGGPDLKILSALPSVVFRHLATSNALRARQRPFQNVRRQFRNQHHDSVNKHCDVVSAVEWPYRLPEGETSPQSLVWLWKAQPTRDPAGGDEIYSFLAPTGSQSTEKERSAAGEVSARYNAISETLRTGAATSTTPYRVHVNSWTADDRSPHPWMTASVEMSINGSKQHAHIAIPSVRPDGLGLRLDTTQSIFCHFPAVGTHMEFRRDSVLSWVESIRSVAAAQDGSQLRTVAAPMPCKVLSILKKVGEPVKSGENVMVIESMKMEVAITVSADGTFQTTWREGDAVEEGKILCSVD
ncbi:hypothetical protein P168DRAFT_228355 [Aspergillus campestris IBT 28561]|uniref:Uncharacterized protein n=1 Tax=Aspergillus campestris (strain IBT 28561) TaxID=1392248 RepID=A0A2I1DHS5_ASPC2|nr:uncharacterized protein P168DRAFT_228355 [Aspergillus campestris IBT 28561]PKY09423.1 hypothetical protein P168DRAFT_228355 [Aspergillus campestris IBT 28561]